MYTVPLVYRVMSNTKPVSISRLCRAIQTIVKKHSVLRTSLFIDSTGRVTQSILDATSSTQTFFGITVSNNNNHHTNNISETIHRSDHFDLTIGRVLHCHIIRQSSSLLQDDDKLTNNDIIMFHIHHSVFDGASTSIFLRDLTLAYDCDVALPIDENALQYIHYSAHERQLDMTTSSDFWRAQLHGYDLEHRLVLPFDRHRSTNDQRSGKASVAEFVFTEQLSRSFLDYASSLNVTPFQLGLAVFYVFLFKLANGQQDLCIGCVNANRYRVELQDIIGMFVATLPYRIQVDPSTSFKKLVEQVRNICLSILEHSHYPLQHIIGNHHSPAFLEIMYDFVTVPSTVERVDLGGSLLESVPLENDDFVAKFDVMLNFVHKSSTEMSCSLVCSEDLFDRLTVQTMIDRFSHLLHQLVDSPILTVDKQPMLYQLSVILPQEQMLIDALKNNDINRPPAVENTIPLLFKKQVLNHPQKVAVELDDQALTYSELFFYAQRLALILLDTHVVKEGDIICQCVERSISMVRLFEEKKEVCILMSSYCSIGDWYYIDRNGWCCILSTISSRSTSTSAQPHQRNAKSSYSHASVDSRQTAHRSKYVRY